MNPTPPNNIDGNVPDVVQTVLKPFQRFARMEAAGGILLLFSAAIAVLWANSGFSSSYTSLFNTPFTVGLGEAALRKPLILWINDGLMAVFFLLVGLEIKRELISGELSNPRKAAFPIVAAIGGMLVPALVYVAFNAGGEGESGWGIPMATDIAFALGILALAGKRVPVSLKIFLTAFAIIDDLGAILVIAFFYTSSLAVGYLLWAGGLLALLYLLGRIGMRKLLPFLAIGLIIWFLFLKSGIHATIAGVLLAAVIPHNRVISKSGLGENLRNFAAQLRPPSGKEEDREVQTSLLHHMETLAHAAQSPLSRLEHAVHPWVSFFIMPVFALANAGVSLAGTGLGSLFSPVGLGVILGLIIGKQLGVLLFAWLGVKLKLASLPNGINWMHIYGAAILGGVGFTMSLFINGLALSGPLADVAKLGILTASALNGILGFLVVKAASKSA